MPRTKQKAEIITEPVTGSTGSSTNNNTATPDFKIVREESISVVSDRGRPLALTNKVFVQICRAIESGMSITDACRVYCVSYRSFRTHVSRKANYQKRLKQAEEVRFNRRHEEALQSIIRAGEKNWLAHAWYLERVLPNRYALKNNVSRETPADQKVIGDKLTEAELLEIQERMNDFANKHQGQVSFPSGVQPEPGTPEEKKALTSGESTN
jgi:hypothetical protein